jgi:hypothetical protein
MSFRGHDSGFDAILYLVLSIQNHQDPVEVDAVAAKVELELKLRVPEDDMYAARRTEGSIEVAKKTLRSAIAARALPRLVSIIDSVHAEAERALALILAKNKGRSSPSGTSGAQSPGAWTQVESSLGTDFTDPFYAQFLDD